MKEPEAPTPTKEGKLAKQSKSAVKRAAKLAAQAGADDIYITSAASGMSELGGSHTTGSALMALIPGAPASPRSMHCALEMLFRLAAFQPPATLYQCLGRECGAQGGAGPHLAHQPAHGGAGPPHARQPGRPPGGLQVGCPLC